MPDLRLSVDHRHVSAAPPAVAQGRLTRPVPPGSDGAQGTQIAAMSNLRPPIVSVRRRGSRRLSTCVAGSQPGLVSGAEPVGRGDRRHRAPLGAEIPEQDTVAIAPQADPERLAWRMVD